MHSPHIEQLARPVVALDERSKASFCIWIAVQARDALKPEEAERVEISLVVGMGEQNCSSFPGLLDAVVAPAREEKRAKTKAATPVAAKKRPAAARKPAAKRRRTAPCA